MYSADGQRVVDLRSFYQTLSAFCLRRCLSRTNGRKDFNPQVG